MYNFPRQSPALSSLFLLFRFACRLSNIYLELHFKFKLSNRLLASDCIKLESSPSNLASLNIKDVSRIISELVTMTTSSDIRLYEMSGTVNNKIELNKQFKRAKKSHVSVRRRPHSEGYYKGHIYESKTYLCVVLFVFPF